MDKKILAWLSTTFDLKFGDLTISPSYLQAVAIIFLLFLLVLTLAKLRRLYVGWSFKGAGGMLAMGFILAVILEGFLILGGRTFLTEILGWQNAPKPIATALDKGREKLVEVLGVKDEVPEAFSKDYSFVETVSIFQSLEESEKESFKKLICEP